MPISHSLRRSLGACLLLALVGAGCDPNRAMLGSSMPQARPSDVAVDSTQGFGKLPPISVSGGLTAASMPGPAETGMLSSVAAPNAPQPMPMNAATRVNVLGTAQAMDSVAGGGTASVKMIAPDYKPTPVEYALKADLPTWETSGDVLRMQSHLPDTSTARSLATGAGVPSSAFSNNAQVNSLSVQWKEADGMQWTFDAGNHFLSFWKETNGSQPSNTKPEYDKDEIRRIADAFLDAHGFSSIRETGAEVDDSSYQVMMKATISARPCPMLLRAEASAGAAMGAPTPAVASDVMVKKEIAPAVDVPASEPAMYPNPCDGWWPQQISVYYMTTREGLPIVEIGGWPSRSNSVTVDLATKQVTNGVLQLDQNFDRSSYPLIDLQTATKKLMAGGTNPAYSWGTEGQKAVVTMTKVELVWMRYDSWVSGHMETYYLPALVATGTVDRGMKDQPAEEYRTSVPLVADSAFQDLIPPPIAIPMMDPAATVAPAPNVK